MSVPNGVLDGVLADLTAEGEYVESLVAGLDEPGWRTATPAEGWDIATTIAHLLWTDETAVKSVDGTLCVNGPEDKAPWDEVVTRALADITGFVDAEAIAIATTHSGAEILKRWRTSRSLLKDKLRTVPEGQKLMWFGPPMSPASMATARLMESWAHGIDVAEGQGITHEQTDRIRHVASLGHRTRNYSFVNSGLDAPAEEFRVELTLPSGDAWTAGPDDAAQTVTGSAYDFCLLVTQRRHLDDLNLTASGADAQTWLKIAQAFAGPAGGGREPLT